MISNPRVSLLPTVVLGATLLFACTTSSSDDESGVTPGVVYDDTLHVVRNPSGICKQNSGNYAYWGLRYAAAGGDSISNRYLEVYVNAGVDTILPGTYPVVAASSEGLTAPEGNAVVYLGGASVYSQMNGRVQVSFLAGGDSVRVIGESILMSNGKSLNFVLTVRSNFCNASLGSS